MERKERIERGGEKTLDCFDQDESIEVNPFFNIRLQAKLINLKKNRMPVPVIKIGRVYWRPALLLIILLINLFSVAYITKDNASYSGRRLAEITEFAHEYSLNQSHNKLYTIEK